VPYTPEQYICAYALITNPVECKLTLLLNSRDVETAEAHLFPFIFDIFSCTNAASLEANGECLQSLLKYMWLVHRNYFDALMKKQISSNAVLLEWYTTKDAGEVGLNLLLQSYTSLCAEDGYAEPEHLRYAALIDSAAGVYQGLMTSMGSAQEALLYAKDVNDSLYQPVYAYYKERRGDDAVLFGDVVQVNIEIMDFVSHIGAAVALAARQKQLEAIGEIARAEAKAILVRKNIEAATRHMNKASLDMIKCVLASIYANGTLDRMQTLPLLNLRHQYCNMNFTHDKMLAYRAEAERLFVLQNIPKNPPHL